MKRPIIVLLLLLFLLALPLTAQAHVKWFSEFGFGDTPLSFEEAITPLFIALTVLSVTVIGGLVFFEHRLSEFALYQRINQWLENQQKHSVTVMRVGAGVVLLMSWQADALLMPELTIETAWIGWLQFIVAVLLLFELTVPLAGLGLMILYFIGIVEFGAFHMLDYIIYLGAGYYLLVSQSKNPMTRGTGLPALYFSIGFSLCWVALEKIIYPQWGLAVLSENPQLTLGFDSEFFLMGAAFVEFSLGYLLIINLLQRPLALVITLVFFTTTLIFGKIEIIGHTLIHMALIVFLFEGQGKAFKPPIAIHKRLSWRSAFASVNFVVLLLILLVPYSIGAEGEYEDAIANQETVMIETSPMDFLQTD